MESRTGKIAKVRRMQEKEARGMESSVSTLVTAALGVAREILVLESFG